MRKVKVKEIVQALQAHGGVLHGDGEVEIASIAPLDAATPGSISFLSNPKLLAQLQTAQAACIIVSRKMQEQAQMAQRACYIIAPDAYAYYAHLTQWWRQRMGNTPEQRIHPSAVVHPDAQIADSAIIGPLCVVERGARIGAGSWLKSCVSVGEGCVIGERCIIHPGAVIGADGFGFAHEDGQWVKIEQLGAVRIGNDVEIGANTCVDRGAIGDTVIEDGVKLDNLIQIAHNVHLGKHVAIAANAGIAGSTTVEEGVTIGGAANIMGHIRLAKGVHISATTFASRSILKPGTYSGHFPFDDNASWEKNAATLRQLYKLRERIKALEQQLHDQTDHHEHTEPRHGD